MTFERDQHIKTPDNGEGIVQLCAGRDVLVWEYGRYKRLGDHYKYYSKEELEVCNGQTTEAARDC